MTEFLLACLALEVEAVDEAFLFYGVGNFLVRKDQIKEARNRLACA